MVTPVYSVGGASELEVRNMEMDRKVRALMRKYNLSFYEARKYAERGVTPKENLNGRY